MQTGSHKSCLPIKMEEILPDESIFFKLKKITYSPITILNLVFLTTTENLNSLNTDGSYWYLSPYVILLIVCCVYSLESPH